MNLMGLLIFIGLMLFFYLLRFIINWLGDKSTQWVKNAYHEYKNEKNGNATESLASLHQQKQNSNEKNNF